MMLISSMCMPIVVIAYSIKRFCNVYAIVIEFILLTDCLETVNFSLHLINYSIVLRCFLKPAYSSTKKYVLPAELTDSKFLLVRFCSSDISD